MMLDFDVKYWDIGVTLNHIKNIFGTIPTITNDATRAGLTPGADEEDSVAFGVGHDVMGIANAVVERRWLKNLIRENKKIRK